MFNLTQSQFTQTNAYEANIDVALCVLQCFWPSGVSRLLQFYVSFEFGLFSIDKINNNQENVTSF